MKRLLILIVTMVIFSPYSSFSQEIIYNNRDKAIFEKYMGYISQYKNSSTDSLIVKSARFFLGTPYVAHTLEHEPESLVINLSELDCTTFVETVFALSMTVKSGKTEFEDFCNNLKKIRYRAGSINGYVSRLHYTSDWIFDNSNKGIVRNVAIEIGEPLMLDLNIMTSNTDRYKQLRGDIKAIDFMKKKEREITARKHFFIKASNIDKLSHELSTGDMVCYVTTIPGIDISHVGIVIKDSKGKIGFIHASSSAKKVVIDNKTVAEYVMQSKKNIGVIFVRPLF